jgi:hypothetical protein
MPLGLILSQINPVHILTPYLLKSHFNIILPFMPSSPKWSRPFRFPIISIMLSLHDVHKREHIGLSCLSVHLHISTRELFDFLLLVINMANLRDGSNTSNLCQSHFCRRHTLTAPGCMRWSNTF